jgi:hypothetical protein
MSAVAVGGFSALDHDLRLLVRLVPDGTGSWAHQEVVRRWRRRFRPTHYAVHLSHRSARNLVFVIRS